MGLFKRKQPVYPQTRKHLEQLFKKHNLQIYVEPIWPFVRHQLVLDLYETDSIAVQQSRIGGIPHLPNSFTWPLTPEEQPMAFIAQINLKDAAQSDLSDLLPADGMLYFFVDIAHYEQETDSLERNRFRVIHLPKTQTSAMEFQVPANISEAYLFRIYRVDFQHSLSIPKIHNELIYGLIEEEDEDNFLDTEMSHPYTMLGYANPIQEDMEETCEEIYRKWNPTDTTGKAEKWILLLQIDSDTDNEPEDGGMHWGDGGSIYFWIRQNDLRSSRFENCVLILQSF